MKHKQLLILLIGVALSGSLAYGQASSPGAITKKPRTVDDYKPGTLKEIVVEDAKRNGLLPFRVRVTYTASVRPISTTSNDALQDWARCCAGNPDHYKGYIRELRFVENGAAYWLAVEDELVADFQKELKIGDVVDLFLILLSPPETIGKRRSVLLVERFQKAGPNSDQVETLLKWIRSNLPSNTGKGLKVEIPGPCRLSVTDASSGAGVSKEVVWIPLTDLDPSRVSVERSKDSDMSELWLHTTANKRAILFMLYQGRPAEGGETSKFSLIIPAREKAESLAEAFRRAIKLCATEKKSLLGGCP
jgi:hypothetical protein